MNNQFYIFVKHPDHDHLTIPVRVRVRDTFDGHDLYKEVKPFGCKEWSTVDKSNLFLNKNGKFLPINS